MNDRATRILTTLLSVLITIGGAATNSRASLILDVTYTSGVIKSGPLSFGLVSLPTEVNATFLLGPGSTEPGKNTLYGIGDVLSANLAFGDGVWGNLMEFDLEVEDGLVEDLTYTFNAIDTLTAEGPVILNFPLMITGTDTEFDKDFEYTYTESSQSISPTVVPEPTSFLVWCLLCTMGWVCLRRPQSRQLL